MNIFAGGACITLAVFAIAVMACALIVFALGVEEMLVDNDVADGLLLIVSGVVSFFFGSVGLTAAFGWLL